MNTIDYFNEKWMPVTESGCWIWIAGTASPYGRFSYRNHSIGAHRASWLLHRGKIPNGLHVCHKCDVPECVNPDHLYLGTPADNARDRNERGRAARGERQGSAKLSSGDIPDIRQHQGQLSLRQTARKYGVDGATIWAVWHRKTWSHIL